MYVSVMERKGIEKGIELGRTEGRELGRAEGEARGIQLGKIETAQNLLRMGFDVSQIAEATGLTLEEVNSLKDTEQS